MMKEQSGERLTRARARQLMEASRMDVAQLMAQTLVTQQKLHAIIGIQDTVWEALLGEPAPTLSIPWEPAEALG